MKKMWILTEDLIINENTTDKITFNKGTDISFNKIKGDDGEVIDISKTVMPKMVISSESLINYMLNDRDDFINFGKQVKEMLLNNTQERITMKWLISQTDHISTSLLEQELNAHDVKEFQDKYDTVDIKNIHVLE